MYYIHCQTYGRGEDNIKWILKKYAWGCGMDFICQESDHWWALVNVVINIWVPINLGNFLTS